MPILLLALAVIWLVDLADDEFTHLSTAGLIRTAIYLALVLVCTYLYWSAMAGYWPDIEGW